MTTKTPLGGAVGAYNSTSASGHTAYAWGTMGDFALSDVNRCSIIALEDINAVALTCNITANAKSLASSLDLIVATVIEQSVSITATTTGVFTSTFTEAISEDVEFTISRVTGASGGFITGLYACDWEYVTAV